MEYTFDMFLEKWQKSYRLKCDENMKYENKKIYTKSNIGWRIVDYIKIKRNIGQYKIGCVHFDCALPYSNYYIINTSDGKIYTMSATFYCGWNGVLKELIEDLSKVRGDADVY